MATVRGQPFLSFLLDQLVATGIRSAVLCTGYLGEQVRAVFGQFYRNLPLDYSHEPLPLGTGGALQLALPLITSDFVLILNGDSLCRFQSDNFWAWHCDHRSEATLLLTHVSDGARYGRVQVGRDGRITSFEEKDGNKGSGWINAGVYLISRRLIQTIPPDRSVSLEREMFPIWISEGLYGCQIGDAFLDIGTPESLALAADFFASKVPA